MIKKLATLKRTINSLPDDTDLMVRFKVDRQCDCCGDTIDLSISDHEVWPIESIEVTATKLVIQLETIECGCTQA